MIWAIGHSGNKIEASPKKVATCPICGSVVVAKCGKIKIWHWSHKDKKECDSWWEPESQWHKDWKDKYPKELQEFTMGCHRADIRTKNRWIIELQNSTISQEKIIEREEYYKRMIWLVNGITLFKGLRIRKKGDTITFRWKNPAKSWWYAQKEIYVDLSGIADKMRELILEYETTDKVHLSTCYEYGTYSYYNEYGDYIEMESDYPTTYKQDTTKNEVRKLKEKINLIDGKILLIKNIYKKIPCGGWGILIKKEEFLEKYK